jgi:hypothetical protein
MDSRFPLVAAGLENPVDAHAERNAWSGRMAMSELSLDDWRAMLTMRPNVLIEGPEAATEAVLRALRPHCAEPASDWGDMLGDQHPPTLIVREVAALTATDQQRLQQWLDSGERSQVLSTTAQSLFSLVERGLFLEALFYRLNVVRLDVQKGGCIGNWSGNS